LESIDRRIGFVHVVFALVFVVLSALALRLWALPRMTELASDKAYFASLDIPPLFDARKQGYSLDDAKRHLEALGLAAREYYAGVYMPGYDLAFPVTLFVFCTPFCLWMTQPTRRFAASLKPRWRLAILIVPLGLFIFDILENISVLAMLKELSPPRPRPRFRREPLLADQMALGILRLGIGRSAAGARIIPLAQTPMMVGNQRVRRSLPVCESPLVEECGQHAGEAFKLQQRPRDVWKLCRADVGAGN
jgi:hypothetical protein